MFSVIFAHVFGQNYNLPLPLWLYLYGGAAAVILSFLIVGFFVDDKNTGNRERRQKLLGSRPAKLFTVLRLLSVGLFILLIITGLIGSQDSLKNFNVTFFWIIFLLGFTYLSALVGNVWMFISPLKVVLDWIDKGFGIKFAPRYKYPTLLGYYPALATYFIIIWLELLSSGASIVPANVSNLLEIYTVITFIGITIYGKEAWLKYGEFFTVFFGLVSHIAPIVYVKDKVYLRMPFEGLRDNMEGSFSLLLFVVFMLASTAFDGFKETIPFSKLHTIFARLPVLHQLPYQFTLTLMLLLSPLFFLIIYVACIWLMGRLVNSRQSTRQLAYQFALTLIPIAIAYNAAHYYTLLVVQGQQILPLLSDPFGWGWNLLHTATYKINVGLVNAAHVWYSQVALILIGHIAAVYVAHMVALQVYPSRKKAMLSQYPMLFLMVVYTMISLWIIAQPLTRG